FSTFERGERRGWLEPGVTAETLKLGTTPIINLFPQTSEPILLTQRSHEYLVVPDARRRGSVGVYSVEDVVAVTPGEPELTRFEPFYSFRHGQDGESQRHFWYARRQPISWRPDEG